MTAAKRSSATRSGRTSPPALQRLGHQPLQALSAVAEEELQQRGLLRGHAVERDAPSSRWDPAVGREPFEPIQPLVGGLPRRDQGPGAHGQRRERLGGEGVPGVFHPCGLIGRQCLAVALDLIDVVPVGITHPHVDTPLTARRGDPIAARMIEQQQRRYVLLHFLPGLTLLVDRRHTAQPSSSDRHFAAVGAARVCCGRHAVANTQSRTRR